MTFVNKDYKIPLDSLIRGFFMFKDKILYWALLAAIPVIPLLLVYVFWFMILGWLFSFSGPGVGAAIAIYKLLCIVIVGFFGGVVIPVSAAVGLFFLFINFKIDLDEREMRNFERKIR